MVLRLRKPPLEEIATLKKGCIHVSFLDPFNEDALVDEFTQCGVTAISMEMIPRTTLAQKMDALSSQANLAGYVAVILGSDRLNKVLPMMMTPAGTIAPSRVFIIGVGVAGLQAIATAKRLGARVEAFDTRPVVEEQVQSLGAKFVKVDLGETGETKDGYAKELTEEQQAMQREGMAKVCAQSDLVITTAQLLGRKAPVIVTKEMVESMKPGSIIIDLAVETGGNVEGSKVDEEVDVNGVTIVGLGNLPGRAAANASQMYSSNLGNLVEHFWDDEEKTFNLNFEDEIIQGCVVTHEGALYNEMIKNARK
jgi:NAD(P) transhydrogenase subunit alpha